MRVRAIALVLLAGLVAPATAPAAEKIKITIPAAAVTFASLYHAKAAGYFAEEGLDVEIVTVPGGGSLQALIAKDAQFCVTPGTYQMQAFEKGQPLLATATILNRNAINVVMHKDVAREKGITEKSPLADKIKALKGLKLSGTAVGSFSYQMMLYYLLKAGIDPQKDVELIGIGAGPPMVLALEQRKIDGFSTGTPIPEAAVARGFGVMIVLSHRRSRASVSRVAVLRIPSDPASALSLDSAIDAGRRLGVTIQSVEYRKPDDFNGAFATMVRERAGGFLLSGGPIAFVRLRHIVALAATHRLPGDYGIREYVDAGGLMSYAPSLVDLYRRSSRVGAGAFVARGVSIREH